MPKKLQDYTDAEIDKLPEREKIRLFSEAEHQLKIKEEKRLKEEQSNVVNNFKAITKNLSDKELTEIETKRPEEAYDLKNGRIPPSLMKEEFNPDMSLWNRWKAGKGIFTKENVARAAIKNFGESFGSEAPKSTLDFAREQLGNEFEVVQQDGRLWLNAKKSIYPESQKYWYPLDQDPTSNLPKVIATFAAPVIAGTAGGMLLGGPGGAVKGALTGTVAGAGLAKEELQKMDWKKEKQNFYHAMRDFPSDVADVTWDMMLAAPLETSAGVAGALVGMPFGMAGITGPMAAALMGGMTETAREKIGDLLGMKQKLSMSDIMTNGAFGGVASWLLGTKPSTALIAKRMAPYIDKQVKKDIPQMKNLLSTNFMSEEEKNAIMDLAPYADNYVDAASKVYRNYEQEMLKRAQEQTKGALSKSYQFAKDVGTTIGGHFAGVPPTVFPNYFRNPKRMVELDINSGKFAGETGRSLKQFAKDRVDKTGKDWGDFLKSHSEIRVDIGDATLKLANSIAELQNKYAVSGLNGQEKEELKNLLKVQQDFFIRTRPDGSQYMRPSVMTPYEAKEFKNEMNEYARWDVLDKNAISDPIERKKIDVARDIYFSVNDTIDNAFKKADGTVDEVLKKKAQQLRSKNEVAHMQKNYVDNIFSEKETPGNPMFDQQAYNILSNPSSKSNVVLTDFVKDIDKSLGLKGPDSYLQKMNDLYTHSYLGSPGSGGYVRGGTGTQGAGVLGSMSAAATREAGIQGQYGYGVGKILGYGIANPNTIKKYMANGIAMEDLIGNALKYVGKDKSIMKGYVPVDIMAMKDLTGTLKPAVTPPWVDMPIEEERPAPQFEDPTVQNNQTYLDQTR